MRELLLILGAACIAALPFVAFNELSKPAPLHAAAGLWSNDLSQANPAYSMPKAMAVSAKIEQR